MGRKAHGAVKGTNKVITVEEGATLGAQLGVNLFDQAGNLLTLAALAAALGVGTTVDTGEDPQGEPGLTIWTNVGEIPGDALSVLGNPTNTEITHPVAIVAGNNDRVLRRVSDALDWGFLTAGMFPDSMVTSLSGTLFAIDTDDLTLSNGQFTINVATGLSPLVIDGNIGDATTPLIDIRNAGLNVDRMLMRFREQSTLSFFMLGDFSNTDIDNRIVWGSDYSGGMSEIFYLYADGRIGGGGGTFLFDPDGTFELSTTAGTNFAATFSAIGDVSLTLHADTDDSGSEDHNPTLRFLQDGTNVRGYIGLAGTAGSDSFGNTFTNGFANALTLNVSTNLGGGQLQIGAEGAIAFHIASDRTVSVQRGNAFRIYDSANTDFVAMSHNGTNVLETFTNTTSIVWSGITGLTVPSGFAITTGGGTFSILGTGETLATFADDGAVVLYHNNTIRIQTSANGVEIPGGSSLRIQDAANTDYGQFSHDGTNFLTTFVNTGKWDITVAEIELNGDLDLDGIFDNDQSVALGGGAAATLGTIGGSGPTAAGQSEWLRIRINGADRWIPVWL